MDDSRDDSKVEESTKRLPPNAGKGRVAGVPNKTTKTLREAILEAAKNVGSEIKPGCSDGLVAYLEDVAAKDKKAMSALLSKVLPMTVVGPENPDGSDGPVVIKIYAGPKKEE